MLGTDGNLWLESPEFNKPWGAIPPPGRTLVDGNVEAFQWAPNTLTPPDLDTLYVLGTDGKLWLEHAPFGKIPPVREQVDANVAAFQALDRNTVYILGLDGNLWLAHAVNGKFGNVPPSREHVDGNVQDFQALDANTVYVLGADGNLWLEHSVNGKFGAVPPPREHVDGNVNAPLSYSTLRTSYQILTVVYAPPGTNGGKSTSLVGYSTGSSTGTTTSTSSSFKSGIDVSASVGTDDGVSSAKVTTDFNFSQTQTDTSALEIKKSEAYEIKVPGPAVDGISHDHDLFYLWLNPILYVTIDRNKHLVWQLAVDGSTQMVLRVAVAWLKNPSQMPPGVKQALDLAGLTTSDYAKILATNPFASGATAIDTNRFVPLAQSFPYEPPVAASDSVPTETYTLTSSTTKTSSHQSQVQYGVSVTVEGGLKGPITASIKATSSFEWTNTSSSSFSGGSTQSASVTVGGPAFGYTGPVDLLVYWDTIYSSFMFAFPTEPPSISGSIVNQSGIPVANQAVTLTVGSQKLSGFTDSRGEYRFYNVPVGQGTLGVQGKDFVVSVGSDAAKRILRLT
jgi:hypothetical protein